MNLKIELVSKRGWFKTSHFWRIVSVDNGETISTSETYSRREKMHQTASRFAAACNIPVFTVDK